MKNLKGRGKFITIISFLLLIIVMGGSARRGEHACRRDGLNEADDVSHNGSQRDRLKVSIEDPHYQDVVHRKGDNRILLENIPLKMDYTMVNPMGNGDVEFWARTNREDVENVTLVIIIEGRERQLTMIPRESDVVYQYYRSVLNSTESLSVYFNFLYQDGNVQYYATPGGFIREKPDPDRMFLYDPQTFPIFTTPDWAKHGVFYQIFSRPVPEWRSYQRSRFSGTVL